MKKERQSNIELLRVIAALLITLNHVPVSADSLTGNYLVQRVFFLGGQTGVSLYVIIGAWFLADKPFKSERVIKLIEQTVFYGLLLDAVSLLLGASFTIKTFLNGFNYWFCFGYAVMLLLKPFLDKLKGKPEIVFLILGGIASVGVTALGFIAPSSIIVRIFLKGMFIGPVWFCYIYILISYIKESIENKTPDRLKCILIFTLGYIIMYIVLLVTHNSSIRELHSPVCLICALSMFICFYGISTGYVPIINKLGTYTFGVYLFQSHQVFRIFLWEKLFHFTSISEKTLLYIPLSIVCAAVIFACAAIIDTFRVKIENIRFYVKIKARICGFIDKIYMIKN